MFAVMNEGLFGTCFSPRITCIELVSATAAKDIPSECCKMYDASESPSF
jgi:hypothetical protein